MKIEMGKIALVLAVGIFALSGAFGVNIASEDRNVERIWLNNSAPDITGELWIDEGTENGKKYPILKREVVIGPLKKSLESIHIILKKSGSVVIDASEKVADLNHWEVPIAFATAIEHKQREAEARGEKNLPNISVVGQDKDLVITIK